VVIQDITGLKLVNKYFIAKYQHYFNKSLAAGINIAIKNGHIKRLLIVQLLEMFSWFSFCLAAGAKSSDNLRH